MSACVAGLASVRERLLRQRPHLFGLVEREAAEV